MERADLKSAIQQVGNLRYELRTAPRGDVASLAGLLMISAMINLPVNSWLNWLFNLITA